MTCASGANETKGIMEGSSGVATCQLNDGTVLQTYLSYVEARSAANLANIPFWKTDDRPPKYVVGERLPQTEHTSNWEQLNWVRSDGDMLDAQAKLDNATDLFSPSDLVGPQTPNMQILNDAQRETNRILDKVKESRPLDSFYPDADANYDEVDRQTAGYQSTVKMLLASIKGSMTTVVGLRTGDNYPEADEFRSILPEWCKEPPGDDAHHNLKEAYAEAQSMSATENDPPDPMAVWELHSIKEDSQKLRIAYWRMAMGDKWLNDKGVDHLE